MKHFLRWVPISLVLLWSSAAVAQPGAPGDPEPELSDTDASDVPEELTRPSLDDDLADSDDERRRVDEDEAEETGQERPPWAGSTVWWDHTVTTTTFAPRSTLTHNPTYTQFLSLQPRWRLSDVLSIRLRQDLTMEMTDTDTRALNREPVVGDTRIELMHTKLAEFEGVSLAGSARLYLPLSTTSQASDTYFTPGLLAAATYMVPGVLEGLMLQFATTYSYKVSGSNVVLSDDPLPQVTASPGLSPAGSNSQIGGPSVTRHSFTAGLTGSLSPIERMTIDASFTWWWRVGAGLADATASCASCPGGSVTLPDNSATHRRLATWFTLGASYDVVSWLNASVTYGVLTAEHNPDGSRRNPFWNVDSAVSLTFVMTPDRLLLPTSQTLPRGATASAQSRTGVQ